MGGPQIRTRRWKRVEYERLIEAGMFHDERLELLDGQLVVKEPQGSLHYAGIRLVQVALERVFGQGWEVRVQGPVALDDDSEPEPDVAVVPGRPRDYRDAHPSRPVLAVEVSVSSLHVDRALKAGLFARGGLADYWILNLGDRVLEVSREPIPVADSQTSWGYASNQRLRSGEAVSPLAAPSHRIAIADLVP